LAYLHLQNTAPNLLRQYISIYFTDTKKLGDKREETQEKVSLGSRIPVWGRAGE